MVAYDILVIEWSETGGLGFVATELYLLKVTEFTAAGTIQVRHQGTKKYKLRNYGSLLPDDRKAAVQENLRLDTELTGEGWRLADPDFAHYITDPRTNLVYVRRSSVSSPMAIAERLATLKDFAHKGNKDNRRTGELLYTLSQRYLLPLEEQIDEHAAPDKLIERLERLSALHRRGDLSDTQFEQAKNAALGL